MSENYLKIYLDDHRAVFVGEGQLVQRCHRANIKTPLGQFLQKLRHEVAAQQAVVSDIASRLGFDEGLVAQTKQTAAWVLEKLGRLKTNGSLLTYSPLSRLLELETLISLAQSRCGFWSSMAEICAEDPRLETISCDHFLVQSEAHLQQLLSHRQQASRHALSLQPSGKP